MISQFIKYILEMDDKQDIHSTDYFGKIMMFM